MEPVADEAGPPGGGCFIAGTLVETSEGPKRIEDIHAGDLVQVRDESKGVTVLKPVVKLFRRHNGQIFDVKLTAPDGHTEVIGATAEHPFHVRSLGWVEAGKLVPGEIVDQLDGAGDRVVSVEPEKSLQDTYNFEVAHVHTRQGARSACTRCPLTDSTSRRSRSVPLDIKVFPQLAHRVEGLWSVIGVPTSTIPEPTWMTRCWRCRGLRQEV